MLLIVPDYQPEILTLAGRCQSRKREESILLKANSIADGLSAKHTRALIEDRGATPNIPPKSNRRGKPCFSKRLYRERDLVERFFSKLKHFRRVATRYDKLAANFLAMVQLASMRLWLRTYESTA